MSPMKPRSACLVPGCPNFAERKGRCLAHHRARETAYNQQHGSAAQRGYGAEWKKLRDRFIAEYPYCRVCGQLATQVDHILPRARGGQDAWENLESLCFSCHSRKSMKERHAASRGGVR